MDDTTFYDPIQKNDSKDNNSDSTYSSSSSPSSSSSSSISSSPSSSNSSSSRKTESPNESNEEGSMSPENRQPVSNFNPFAVIEDNEGIYRRSKYLEGNIEKEQEPVEDEEDIVSNNSEASTEEIPLNKEENSTDESEPDSNSTEITPKQQSNEKKSVSTHDLSYTNTFEDESSFETKGRSTLESGEIHKMITMKSAPNLSPIKTKETECISINKSRQYVV